MIKVQKAVIKRNNKYLVILRADTAKYFPKHWDFPGGKLEEDEDPIEGIIREIKEETNVNVKSVKVIAKYRFDLDNKGVDTHEFTLYEALDHSGEVKLSDEHTDFKWLSKEEILELTTNRIVGKYMENLGSVFISRKEEIIPISDVCGELKELYNSENVSISYARMTAPSTPHTHFILEEIYFITKGSGKIIIGEEEYKVSAGDTIAIPKNKMHQTIPNEYLELLVITHPKFNKDDIIK